MATPNVPLWEVFIRSRNGLAHKHVGSLHAADATLALQAARDIYTRRGEGLSIWVVPLERDHRVGSDREGHDVRAGGVQDLPPPDVSTTCPTKSGICELSRTSCGSAAKQSIEPPNATTWHCF